MISEMRITAIVLFICILGCKAKDDKKVENVDIPEIKGVDISFYPQINAANYVYKSSEGFPFLIWDQLRGKGINTIRLRVWNDDTHFSSSPASVAELARTAKENGMNVIVDFHFSDSWADPGKQTLPAAWKDLTFSELKDTIYNFTYFLMKQIPCDFVQLGNELNNGFLWPHGNINKLNQFLDLYRGALAAARAANPNAKVILHFAGQKDANWFYSQFKSTDYDIAGISYYPFWHGKNLSELTQTLSAIKNQTKKQVIILETAYPFTLAWKDQTHNVIGDTAQLLQEFPATPQGQSNYLKALRKAVSDAGGSGVCYWGAEWVAYKGDTSKSGSTWENQALWDFNGLALPANFN
jgi:arabinogalactan endo-1,4-beta-galactosidase